MIDQGQVIGLIPARGRSKGVPRKNLRTLGGRPLIVHAVEVARACAGIDRVVVSTEDDEIAETALAAGAEVPFRRPVELATDDAPEWLVWRHAVQALAVDGAIGAVVTLSPTAPLRGVADVEACLALLRSSDADLVLTVCASDRHPRFNMVSLEDGDRARLAMPTSTPIHRRQDAPALYNIATVAYAWRPTYVGAADSLFEGIVRAVEVPPERAVDIDSELDLAFAEFLWRRRGERGEDAA